MGRKALTVEQIEQRWVSKTEGCWNWLGQKNNGYSKIGHKQKYTSGHRFFYEAYKGKIPENLQIDHLCKNKICVNPDHLEAVTAKENILRSNSPTAQKSRQTHCIRSHKLDGINLYITPDGRRQCKECGRLRTIKSKRGKN